MQLGVLWVLKPLPLISNTVPAPFAPPSAGVPNRSPCASAISSAIRAVRAVEAEQGGGGAGIAVGGLGDFEHRTVVMSANCNSIN
jgi:hypothetical protein